MNNEQQSEQQKAIRRFFIGSFFIALLCAAVVDLFLASMDRGSSDEVVWVFFYTFFIVFIPSAITTFVFYITQEKASRYYGRYLLVAFFMPFLIPIIVGLFLHFVDLNWDSTIDTIIGTYFLLGLPCTIFGIVQLVLAVVCLPEMHK